MTDLPVDLEACSLHPDECCNCPPSYDVEELEQIKALARGTGKMTAVEINIVLNELDRLVAECRRLRAQRDAALAVVDESTDVSSAMLLRRSVRAALGVQPEPDND
jgi:hypothetical protein